MMAKWKTAEVKLVEKKENNKNFKKNYWSVSFITELGTIGITYGVAANDEYEAIGKGKEKHRIFIDEIDNIESLEKKTITRCIYGD